MTERVLRQGDMVRVTSIRTCQAHNTTALIVQQDAWLSTMTYSIAFTQELQQERGQALSGQNAAREFETRADQEIQKYDRFYR